MWDLRQMAALAAVIEERGFDKAAAKLHITQSAVSQRVRQLEERLGQTLVVRSTPVQPTVAGQQLLKYFRQVSLLQGELASALSPEQQAGRTRIAIGVNADSLATWFLSALSPVFDTANVVIDLRVDDQEQTHHLLRTGEVMGCISSSASPVQGCRCIPLGVTPYRCLATPSYAARYFPQGTNTTAFRRAPVVEFNQKDELQKRYLKRFFNLEPAEYSCHRIPSSEAFYELILRGHACGMVPDLQSREALASGQLLDLTPDQFLAVPLYWHVWNLSSETLDLVTARLIEGAAEWLDAFHHYPQVSRGEPI